MSRTQPDLYEYPKPRQTTFAQSLWCFFGMHKWTSRIELGLQPDKERVNTDTIPYFFEFATPVCKHCPRQLPPRPL